ncbi:MAG: putative HTH-type transcriptional regulator YddM [Syntrophorhabdus sp. PtaU1.Bin153]|nr:MAG: putative HTH-type transcriptional regulator YddM [Syntrophorhabdus sp. PtaU1.Bin153]
MRTRNRENEIRPFRPVLPGEILKDELEARGWTQGDFADITGKPLQAVNEIISGKKAITPETAVLFSDALGTSAEFWLNLESAYRLDLVRQKTNVASAVSRKARIYSLAPLKELIKRGWIKATDEIDELEKEVLKFLQLPDLEHPPAVAARFRTSNAGLINSPSLIAWVRKVEIEAQKISCPPFDRSKLRKALPGLRVLSAMKNGPRLAIQNLCELGVRVVIIPHLPQTRVDGAAFWLDSGSPVIALSLRLDRIDNFWFTLMHEIGHILEGPSSRKGYLDSNIEKEPEAEEEKKVNDFARDQLIPEKALRDFVGSNKPYFSRPRVLAFAGGLGIHPAVVVGRLQYENEIPYTHFRNILEKTSAALNRDNQ